MSNPDQIQRFIFDNADLRGVLVGLEHSYHDALARHTYPEVVQELLGEMLAAVGLLSSTLKFEGRLSLQAIGDGPVSLLMAECNHQRDLRAIARWNDALADQQGLIALLGKGQLAITIEPDQGKRYQGIVPMSGDALAQCLEQYFEHSEQLATRIKLAADGQRAAGFLLQALPGDKSADGEDWDRITCLGDTLTDDELLGLDNEPMLFRLFHEEQVRMYEADSLRFRCDCSRERSLNALRSVPQAELEEIVAEQGHIEIDCQFCNQSYRFDAVDVGALFSAAVTPDAPGQAH
ncbi:Hsp33 family molecular chaperone HslO [Motiliproteus sediminis]|uniref:Hsp33 family molecular chaperone HslO n=1 Tax=Motiliproteus sediminis TaxID=1468178 RepID=UPI001AEF5981|nr:Hsp33 family molecular chaperone HslO [Motiliproteus sediminis]